MTDKQRREQDRAQMLQWVERQNVVLCHGRQEHETAREYLREAAAIFQDLVSKVSGFYLFRQSEQTGDDKNCDGICWWRDTPSGMQYAVGLAVEALEQGKSYFVGLFLHELAHVTNGRHTEQGFYSYLDEMAGQYRRITGEAVFPDHHDFEPDAPPSGPGRPRKTTFSSLGGHSAEDARRKMIARQYRKDHRGA